jgi:hypothetical protein
VPEEKKQLIHIPFLQIYMNNLNIQSPHILISKLAIILALKRTGAEQWYMPILLAPLEAEAEGLTVPG